MIWPMPMSMGWACRPNRCGPMPWYKRAQNSTGPDRLREAARTNGDLLAAKLTDAQKQAADRVDTPIDH